MERQRIYNQQVTANPNQNIRQAQIPSAPQVEGAGYGLIRAVGNAGGEIVKLVAKDYAREWQGRMEDAVLRTNAEFERWKTEYMRTRQGVDALTAQEDFANKYAELSQQTVAGFGNQRGSEIYRAGLERELTRYGLYAVKAGGDYQMQQDEAWQKSQWDAQLSSFQKIIEDNPLDADMIAMEQDTLLRSWMAKNPGLDPGAMREKLRAMAANGRMNSLLARGSAGDMTALDDAERILGKGANAGGGKLGDGVAGFESGKDGVLAIGYDPNGGTSYGKWQLSSKQGSYGEWLNLLAAKGEKGAGLAKELRAAGNSNTGSKKGASAETYKRLAAENPELFEETQREYLEKTHYAQAMKSLPANARAMVESDAALKDMVFSTAVQHGGGGASKILGRAWKDGMSKAELVRAVYAGRANPGNFASTPKDMAQNITGGRFPEERDAILGRLDGKGGASPSLPGLSASDQMVFQHKIDAMRKAKQAELRVGLDSQIDDFLAAAADGKAGDLPVTSAQVSAAYGDKADKVMARLNDAVALNRDISMMNNSDAATINGMIKAAEPQAGEGYALQRGFQAKRQEAAKRILDARAKDPSGYLMSRNPQRQAEYNAMLQNPTPQTVAAYMQGMKADAEVLKLGDVPIFPKDQAKAFAGQIMAANDTGTILSSLQAAFGRYWPKAMQELCVKDGLPMAAQMAANGMPQDDARSLLLAAKDKDFQKNFYDLRKDIAKKDLEDKVWDTMRDFNATILAGKDDRIAAELNNCVSMLAMQYINSQGMDWKDAIRKAADSVILSRYSIGKVNGGSFRVPAKLDGNAIERGAGNLLQQMANNAEGLHTTEYKNLGERAGIFTRNHIVKAGRWITNGDETGLAFFVGNSIAYDKNGNPVVKTWAELQKAAGEKRATTSARGEY